MNKIVLIILICIFSLIFLTSLGLAIIAIFMTDVPLLILNGLALCISLYMLLEVSYELKRR